MSSTSPETSNIPSFTVTEVEKAFQLFKENYQLKLNELTKKLDEANEEVEEHSNQARKELAKMEPIIGRTLIAEPAMGVVMLKTAIDNLSHAEKSVSGYNAKVIFHNCLIDLADQLHIPLNDSQKQYIPTTLELRDSGLLPASHQPASDNALEIVSSDLLIPDTIVSLPSPESIKNSRLRNKYANLSRLIDKMAAAKDIKRGDGKAWITEDEKRQFEEASKDIIPAHDEPGGSTFIILRNFKSILGDKVNVNFIGSVGSDPSGDMVREELAKTGIHLQELPSRIRPKSAESFIFIDPDPDGKKRTVFTYAGNAGEIIQPGEKEAINNSASATMSPDKEGMLLLSGTHWEKFPKKNNENATVADLLLRSRWDAGKHERRQDQPDGEGQGFWLALSKQAKFGKETPKDFTDIIPSANLVTANGDVLMRIFNTDDPQTALERLQEHFKSSSLNGSWHGKKGQIGFVTFGNRCAYVDKEGFKFVKVPGDKPIFDGLAAEELAFAAFAAGCSELVSPRECADIAISLVQKKAETSPDKLYLPNLQEALEELQPRFAALLRDKGYHRPNAGGWTRGSGRSG